MADFSTHVEWAFVVPPGNTTRVLICQRRDGPFRTDVVGSRGYYYVSLQDIAGDCFVHRMGSTRGGLKSYAEAEAIAEELWTSEQPARLSVP